MKSRSLQYDPKGPLRLLQEVRRNWMLFLMILPALLYFLVFCYLPLPGVYIAFVNYNAGKGIWGSTFVGLDNFRYLVQSGQLWLITRNTLLYNLAFLLLGNLLQIAFAIMLAELGSPFFKRFSQSVILLPYFISYVIVGVFSYNLFSFDNGFINTLRVSLGMERYPFYTDPDIWKYLIVVFNIWHGLGYGMIIYLAAIAGIDTTMYEAAVIDGASRLQRILYLTLPMLKSTFMMLILFAMGGIMRGAFDLFYNLVGTNSLLYPQTDIIDTFVFRSLAGTGQFNFAQGAAAGLYQSVFGLIIVLAMNTVVRRTDPESALF